MPTPQIVIRFDPALLARLDAWCEDVMRNRTNGIHYLITKALDAEGASATPPADQDPPALPSVP